MKYPQNLGNSKTYRFDSAIQNITRTDEQKVASSLSPRKVTLGIAKNYRGISLTSIAAKIHNTLLLNFIEREIEKILGKSKNGFRRNRCTT